ncbi:MAG: large subunit ribosomal protein L3 [Myxococcota bacterium]|jgi:large subunit ribosomal protein L3
MTQIWNAEGNRMPVTVVQAGPVTVAHIKSAEGRDGYDAIQLAYEEVKESKLTKPELGVFKTLGIPAHRHLREFRIRADEASNYEKGMVYGVDFLKMGHFVDVVGTSKGRGFAGVLKKYNFHGADAGHGAHEAYRHPGTGGVGSATPGRVPKGQKRPGQMGNKRVTVQNVMVLQVDRPNSLVFLLGGAPGPIGSIVQLHEANKAPDA